MLNNIRIVWSKDTYCLPERYVSFEWTIRNVFLVPNHVFPDIQSVFPDFQSELFAQRSLSLRENGKSLATLQRLRNILAFTDVTVARARNPLPHLPHVFPPWSGPFSPSRFPAWCNIPCPRHQTVPRVVASVARESQALATVTPVISNGLGGGVARLQEFSRIACMVHIKPLF